MTGEILTPSSIWSKVEPIQVPLCQTIGEYKEGETVLYRLRLDGRQTSDGQVKIYAVLAKPNTQEKAPAVFIVQQFTDGADETLAMCLAKQGFVAFVVNVGGDDGINNNFTQYPQSLSYVNYKNASQDLCTSIDSEVTKTCWFEWGVTARYGLKYLNSLDYVEKVAGLGIGDGATVVWHMTASEKFDCLAFVLNTGWEAYKGNYKFLGKVDEQFDDAKLNYLAGIEPQAYASLIKVPTFIASSTNNARFDFDRAHDTFSRISDKYKNVIHYTVGGLNGVDSSAYQTLVGFFKDCLIKQKVDHIPEVPTIKCVDQGKIFRLEVSPYKDGLKNVKVFVAEEHYNPSLRQWQELQVQKEEEEYVVEYLPYNQSGVVFFFATAEYKNGYSISSNVLARKFTEQEVLPTHKSKIIYSSREQNSKSTFYPAGKNLKKPSGISVNKEDQIVESLGAMGIKGITCPSGLLTFRIGMKKYRPQEDGMLLVDAYIKQGGKITVKLIADYYGYKREYLATANVAGGEVWHNLKFAISNFKTAEGMSIRSIDSIEALEVHADKEYLVNNLLWV